MAGHTKDWIVQKMLALLNKKSMDSIRVKEICKNAGIGTATFYYHFKDKYDLVAWMIWQALKNDIPGNIETCTKILKHMKQNQYYYQRLDSDPVAKSFISASVMKYYIKQLTALVQKETGFTELDPQTAFDVEYYCCGRLFSTIHWVVSNRVMPPESYARHLAYAMPPSLQHIFPIQPVEAPEAAE